MGLEQRMLLIIIKRNLQLCSFDWVLENATTIRWFNDVCIWKFGRFVTFYILSSCISSRWKTDKIIFFRWNKFILFCWIHLCHNLNLRYYSSLEKVTIFSSLRMKHVLLNIILNNKVYSTKYNEFISHWTVSQLRWLKTNNICILKRRLPWWDI